jgi:PHD/YefM family antitoxin component YafN of YafNO toxin-antitoxin module
VFYGIVNKSVNGAIKSAIMNHISANELKTRGIAAIEQALATEQEAIVSVRGKDRFVILDMAQYQRLRECELEVALAEARSDVAAGRVMRESPEAHLARLDAMA